MDKHPVLTSPGYFALFLVDIRRVILYTEYLITFNVSHHPLGLLSPLAPKKILFGFRSVYIHVRLGPHLIDTTSRSMGLDYFVEQGQPTNSYLYTWGRLLPHSPQPHHLHLPRDRDGVGPQ